MRWPLISERAEKMIALLALFMTIIPLSFMIIYVAYTDFDLLALLGLINSGMLNGFIAFNVVEKFQGNFDTEQPPDFMLTLSKFLSSIVVILALIKYGSVGIPVYYFITLLLSFIVTGILGYGLVVAFKNNKE